MMITASRRPDGIRREERGDRIGEPFRRVFEDDGLAARTLLLLAAADQADRTGTPFDVDMNFNISRDRSVPMCA